MESIKGTRTSEFKKVAGHKINIQNSVAFLCSTITSTNMKNFENNLQRYLRTVH